MLYTIGAISGVFFPTRASISVYRETTFPTMLQGSASPASVVTLRSVRHQFPATGSTAAFGQDWTKEHRQPPTTEHHCTMNRLSVSPPLQTRQFTLLLLVSLCVAAF